MLSTRPSTARSFLAGNESISKLEPLLEPVNTIERAQIIEAAIVDEQANDNRDTQQPVNTAPDSATILSSTVPVLDVKASTGRQLSAQLARIGQEATDYKKRVIYDALIERENMLLNSASDGVALISIPLIGLRQPHSFLVRCAAQVPFNTPDGHPIELVFMLLSPVNIGHTKGKSLQVLASAARLLKEPSAREALRQATSANAVQALLQTAG